MKKAGLIILIIGIFITAYTGFNFETKEKVVEIGDIEVTHDKDHRVSWSPLFGVGVIVLGAGLMLFGKSKLK